MSTGAEKIDGVLDHFRKFWIRQAEVVELGQAKWGIEVIVLPLAPLVGLWIGLGHNILLVLVAVLIAALWIVLGGTWEVAASILSGAGVSVLFARALRMTVRRHGIELLKIALPAAVVCYIVFSLFL